jgi:hypothetical protein
MLSMVNSSQSVASGAGSSASANPSSTTSSATSTTMSSGASVAHAIASLAHTGLSNPQPNFTAPRTVTLPHSLAPTRDNQDAASQLRHHQHISSATNNAAAVLTSVSRMPAPAPKKRSTKSKCSPGLRSGKWTMEEEAFTNMIIYYFKRGLLDVEDGTSLRWYLAKRLNCEAMRVTKKLKGNSSIGKQIFRAVENTPANRQAIRQAREELAVIEARFLESLNAGGVGPGTQHMSSAPLPSSLAVNVRGRKILPNMPTLAPMPPGKLPKSEDARLLLHFFSEAKDSNSEDEPESEKESGKTGSLSVDLSGKLGKKRQRSGVAKAERKVEKTAVAAVAEDDKKDDTTPEQPDPMAPQSKRQAVETDKLTE